MQNKLKNTIMRLLITACVPLALFYTKIFGARRYYLAAFVFALFALLSVFLSFEKSKQNSLKLALTAVMCALGIAGRAVFAAVPFFKPVGAVTILAGLSFGPRTGFLCGALIMLISNFMFGQGPWTVFQMLGFGIMGALSGLLFYKRERLCKPLILSVFGFLCYVLITGPILDLSGIFAFSVGGKASLYATLLAGLPVNLTGGAATAFFLFVLSKPIISKLKRIINKYNI